MTDTKYGDILRTQENVPKIPNNDLPYEHRAIDDTPFWIRCVENKWFLTMGQHKLTADCETEQEAMEYLQHPKMWHTIMVLFLIMQLQTNPEDLEKELQTPDGY